MNAEDTVFNVNTDSHDDASSNGFNLCRVAHQEPLPAYMQAAALVDRRGPGPMTIKTHCKVAERQCYTTVQGPMNILPGKSFHVHIANVTATPVSLPTFMIVDSVSNASTCIIHAGDDGSTC